MAAAPFVWRPDGRPDWRAMWESFCELALHGGPPHRGPDRALHAPVGESAGGDPAMLAELRRGIWETTGLFSEVLAPGWLALTCTSPAMAGWLARAIELENVAARVDGDRLLLPAGPDYRLEDQVKSTITVVAKTHHYWEAHGAGAGEATPDTPRQQFRCVRCGLDFVLSRPAQVAAAPATCPIDGSRMARWDGAPTAGRASGLAYEHAHGPGQPWHVHGATAPREIARSPRGIPKPLVVGVGGPAGTGKSTLIESVRRRLARRLVVAVSGAGILRGDAPTPDLLFVERTGESAAATFSPDLVDATIGVLDLATAVDPGVPPGRWRLLVVSRLDAAPARGVDVQQLERALRARLGDSCLVLADLTTPGGADPVVAWLERELLLGL
jgi:Ni2+-binding GTPase involved in maturation of urease and hydrogenase